MSSIASTFTDEMLDQVSHAARYPARHGIPDDTVSHPALSPTRRCLPPGTVSHSARCPTRPGIPPGTVSHPARAASWACGALHSFVAEVCGRVPKWQAVPRGIIHSRLQAKGEGIGYLEVSLTPFGLMMEASVGQFYGDHNDHLGCAACAMRGNMRYKMSCNIQCNMRCNVQCNM